MHRLAPAADETGEIADPRRQHRLDALAHAARDHRRSAAGADGNDDIAAIDDGGKDESRMRKVVHHIDGQTDRLRTRRHRRPDIAGAGAKDGNHAREIGRQRIAASQARSARHRWRRGQPDHDRLIGGVPADPRAGRDQQAQFRPRRVRPRRLAAPGRLADREIQADIACGYSLPPVRGLTGIIFYICLVQHPQRENYFFSIAVQL